jgi:hypothetical protein
MKLTRPACSGRRWFQTGLYNFLTVHTKDLNPFSLHYGTELHNKEKVKKCIE